MDPSIILAAVDVETAGAYAETAGRAMGMKLLAYDPFISAERAEQLGCRLVCSDAPAPQESSAGVLEEWIEPLGRQRHR